MSKGSHYERELKSVLDDRGFSAARIGASGAGTTDDLPDVIALGGVDRNYVIEAKYRTDPYVALSQAEIDALLRFARPRGIRPLVAFRVAREPWRFYSVDELHLTGSGYSVTADVYEGKGGGIADL